MHLNECLSLAKSIWESKSHPFLSLTSPHGECVQAWMWKSTTNFHNHEEMKNRLNDHPWFGLLCWTFTAGGLILLLLPPRVTSRISYPRYSFASYLIFIQGPLAFLADYVYLTYDHPVHTIDRFSALTMVALELYRHLAIMPCMRLFPTAAGIALSLLVALYSFSQSQRCQSEMNVDGFLFWHSMWHLYPLMCGAIEIFDVYCLGEYLPKWKREEDQIDDVVRQWEHEISAKFAGIKKPGRRSNFFFVEKRLPTC